MTVTPGTYSVTASKGGNNETERSLYQSNSTLLKIVRYSQLDQLIVTIFITFTIHTFYRIGI